MEYVQLGSANEIVIPVALVNELGLSPGDYLELSLKEGQFSLRPAEGNPDEGEERLGPETLAGIKEGLRDLAEGRIHGRYNNVHELFAALDVHNES